LKRSLRISKANPSIAQLSLNFMRSNFCKTSKKRREGGNSKKPRSLRILQRLRKKSKIPRNHQQKLRL